MIRRSPKNTTVHRVINTTFIFDPQQNGRDPKQDRGCYSRKARSATCISIPIDKTRGAKRQTRRQDRPHPKRAKRTILLLSLNSRRPRTKGPDRFPSECIPQHEAPLSAAPKEQDKGASSARTHSEGNPSGPGESHRVIDYPVFCNPAETPVTVERIRLMYSAFFSSAISSWFIRTSRRARTWAMDRAST